MTEQETPIKQVSRRRWSGFRFDVLLLAFLLVGWSLIFTTATLGLQNTQQQWLPVGLVSQASVDYSVKAANAPRLARINPEVIEAVKRDQILIAPPTPSLVPEDTPTLTVEPTSPPVTALSALEVSAGGPYYGDEGSQVLVTAALTGSVLNLVPGVVSYVWDLDDDGQYNDATGASTSVLFNDDGEYPIGVQASNLLEQVGIATTTVFISNLPPLVDIGQDIQADEGQEVAFAATASDPGQDVLLYEWDFGDGTPKVNDTLTPRHTYLDNDIYLVRLTVRDNDGGKTEDTLAVKVDNKPPVVDAGPDQSVNEGDRITFKGTATDPGPRDTLTYAWDFNYDGRSFTTEATGESTSTVYPNGPANIVAALRVRDKDGGETIDTVKVSVINVPPVITSVSNDGPVGEGSPLALTVTATDVGNDPLTYAYDWDNNGSFDAVDQPDTISNIWYNQGAYTVRIRVDDGDGGQAFTTTKVETFNEPPVAVASADNVKLEGSPVSFDGSDSSDPGRDDVLTYQWDFGDGKSASGVTLAHVYGDNGVYSTTLTVTDDSGDFGTNSVGVTVLNANPTAEAGADLTLDEGSNISLPYSGTATDPGADDILTYAWDFDYKNGVFDQDATGASGTYIYPSLDGLSDSNSNPLIVALRVRDDDYPFSTTGGGEIGEALDTFKVTIKNLPPWNVSAGGPYNGVETAPINLSGTAEDAPSDVPSLVYEWDLDDNPLTYERAGKNVSYTWNNAGNHPVRLRVTDKDGGVGFASTQVTIDNALPYAEANGPYTATVTSMPITLNAAGSSDPTNDPLTYRWDFGDGITATTTSITVTHTYSDDRVYAATLLVDDGRGGTDTDTTRVTITNLSPTALATVSPNPVAKGASVRFDASLSTDPDDTALTYQWNFGDGNFDSGVTVDYVYTEEGTFNVILTVADDDGATATTSIPITVNNSPPIAVAGPDQTIAEGSQASFDGSGSSDPNGDPLTYTWDFGDGSPVGNGVTVSHTYLNGPATYSVTLTVTDSDGAVSTDTLQVTVNNVAPTANAGGDRTVDEGAPVTFDGSGSTDPGNDITTYTWDFGDGSPVGNGVTVSYTYPNGPANYNLTLTVTDSAGAVDTDTVSITVNNLPPTARATADQTTVAVGQTVNFDGSSSTDPGNDPLTYTWDFGDGTTGNGPVVSYSWTISGTYTIMLQVDDGNGGSDTTTLSLQVN